MATTTPTGRVFPVPDLVGQKAAHAIEQLRDLGLTPVPLPAVVADLSQAGYVLGLDPPPTSPVRAKQRVTLSVATHPDFDGRAEAGIDELPSTPVQPPLAWPQSADAGVASPEPEFDPRALSRAPTSAATPGVSSAPAPSLGDAAFGEFPHDRGDSRADSPTSGVAAEPYEDDLAASVPTPDDYAALDEWDRMRAAEEASYANEHAPVASANTLEATFVASPIVQPEQADVERERVAEEEAKREARRRSARRYRRLTIKQKLIVGAVFALTLVLVVAAASNHKPRAHRAAAVTKPTKTEARAKATKHRVAPKKHKPAAPAKQRVIVVRTRTRTRTKVVTVTVTTPTSTPTSSDTSSYVPPASSSVTQTHAPATSTTTTPVTKAPAKAPAKSPSSSTKPASTHASADPTSSGTGGGSTLQNPDGATAPPNPTQP